MDFRISWIASAVLLSGAVAGTFLWLLGRVAPRRDGQAGSEALPPGTSSFLLHRDRIVDVDDTPPDGLATVETWTDLRRWFSPRFPGLPSRLEAHTNELVPAAEEGDGAFVRIEAVRGRHRVTLHDPHRPSPAEWHDMGRSAAAERLFADMAKAAPLSVCTFDADGMILWRNAQFETFSDSAVQTLIDAAQQMDAAAQTVRRVTAGERHYEVSIAPIGGHRVLYADDFTRLVNADTERGIFLQTLNNTFADLAIGLVVFDRARRLVLFNTAITDLTGLPEAFLNGRPGLLEFFDQLRDRHVLPEPKNYATWRAQINDMVATAADGRYAEAWTLPNGRTYRVTGRPHSDGTVVFLFEDISNEMLLTRRSRAQREMCQAVLDQVNEGIAVIGADGVLVFCNTTCRHLLDFNPDSRFTETSFGELISICRTRFPCPSVWNDITNGSGGGLPRRRIEAPLPNGPEGPAQCRLEPLPGGFVMLCLSHLQEGEPD